MKILLIGSGGREHSLVLSIKKSRYPVELHCWGTNYNYGIKKLVKYFVKADIIDPSTIKEYIDYYSIDLVIIGPEAPLAKGIVNYIEDNQDNQDNQNNSKHTVYCIGPRSELALIESSKSFARNLMMSSGLELFSPKYKLFNGKTVGVELEIREYIENELGGFKNYVIKCDGLCGGKGVKVAEEHLETINNGIDFCKEIFHKNQNVLIEERLIGQEFSLFSFTDGITCVHMPIAQDYKRAYEGNTGPNTGGMGSITYANGSMPFLTNDDIQTVHTINERIVNKLYETSGQYYKGILYGSFMKTNSGQLKVIEFNCRFGDPESINLLEILETDIVDIFQAISNQTLHKISEIKFRKMSTVCKYLVPKGYPQKPIRNFPIDISNIADINRVRFASVDTNQSEKDDIQILGLGSRTLAVVAQGNTLSEAEQKVENIIKNIESVNDNMFHRSDIGKELSSQSITYQSAGVDINKNTEVIDSIKQYVTKTYNHSVGGNYGDFGGMFMINPFSEYSRLLVTSMDGVGTKSILVTETYGIEGYRMLGHDLVNHCVNDILVQGARPLFFLDYFASSRLDPKNVTSFVRGLSESCCQTDCVLIGGETAEMPDVYRTGHSDLVGTIVGTLDFQQQVINGKSDIKEGDIIFGLRSSGPHTNGYTLIRRILENEKLNGRTVSKNILDKLCASHRCYLDDINKIKEANIPINGLCHITGGGFIENPPRIIPDGLQAVINYNSWELPEEFQFLKEKGNISDLEMHRTFNCGIGMLIIVNPKYIDSLTNLFDVNYGFVIGHIASSM